MEWTKPTFFEISLSGEVTAYANMDSLVQPTIESGKRPVRNGESPDSQ